MPLLIPSSATSPGFVCCCLQKDFDDDEHYSSSGYEEQLIAISAGNKSYTDALAGLQQLAVLDTNINCLAVHAAFAGLACCSALTQLCIEMVGRVKQPGSCIAQRGLQQLPHVKKMELYTNVSLQHAQTSKASRLCTGCQLKNCCLLFMLVRCSS
jgi:hypothetical protein